MKYLPYILGAVIIYFVYKQLTKPSTSINMTGGTVGGGSKRQPTVDELRTSTEASIKRAMGL
jgi:hypothetical protein